MDYVRTPFYQTAQEVKESTDYGRYRAANCTRFPQKNYKPYQLFALRTRLQPLINKHFGLKSNGDAKYIVRFNQVRLNDRLIVVVRLHRGVRVDNPEDDIVKLTKINHQYVQSAVDWITSREPDLSLLINDDTTFMFNSLKPGEKTLIPNCWSQQITKFLSFSSHIRPHSRRQTQYQIPGIYVDLSRMIDYRKSYNDIYINIVRQINLMYEDGFLSLPTYFDVKRLDNWQTKPIGLNIPLTTSEENDPGRMVLFRARWRDTRLSGPAGGIVPFLQKHLVRGSNQVLIDIGNDDAITRHRVAKTFRGHFSAADYRFRNNFVEVKADNLIRAQQAASLVEKSKLMPVGKVITMYGRDPRQFNTYLTRFPTSDSKLKISMLGYQVDDSRNLYCLSCQIPYESNPQYYYEALSNWYKQVINQVEVPPIIPAVPLPIAKPVDISPIIYPPVVLEEKPKLSIKTALKPVYLKVAVPKIRPSVILPGKLPPTISFPTLPTLPQQVYPQMTSILTSLGIPAAAAA